MRKAKTMILKNFTPVPLSDNDIPAPDCVVIYADGACKGNPGPGGWAATARVYVGGELVKAKAAVGGDDDTTNNRMEILAALEAIKLTAEGKDRRIFVRTDSKNLVQTANEWLPGWIAKGWRKSGGKPVMNRDLLEDLVAALETRNITFEHVPGHAGNAGNEEVDELASAEAAERTPVTQKWNQQAAYRETMTAAGKDRS